ncbi:MAG: bifunctional riboflavin kinase/FAD synthetase [Christensenellaceae bacterium]|jgi:riboflavin kinase/FMN adenylyltransferase
MKILKPGELPLKKKTAIAIGLFDGVHIGHQALIHELMHHKNKLVYTFDNKPKTYKNIYTGKEKRQILADMGMDYYYSQNFTEEFAGQSPEDFIAYLKEMFCPTHITVGFDFRFGKNAQGDIHTLNHFSAKYEYHLSVIGEIMMGGEKVSSTRIRELIFRGDVEEAMRLLGRCYFIEGAVEKGKNLGSKIGFPTANISTGKILPAYGVYATVVNIGGRHFNGVTNVGIRPTVSDEHGPNIETYIMDFDENAYGQKMRVNFIKMLRPEKKFMSIKALMEQINEDKHCAEKVLAENTVYKKWVM